MFGKFLFYIPVKIKHTSVCSEGIHLETIINNNAIGSTNAVTGKRGR